jgi:hypothetical protein
VETKSIPERTSTEVAVHPRVVFITPGGLCYHVHKQCAGPRNVAREPAHRRACAICCFVSDDPSTRMGPGPPWSPHASPFVVRRERFLGSVLCAARS